VDRRGLEQVIREQALWCERLGSPLYHSLLIHLANDLKSDGVCWPVLEPHAADPARSLLPLRFLAAVHRLALEGQVPLLAWCYPSCGGAADPQAAWSAFLAAVSEQRLLRIPATVQTNEVNRCCALLPGFLRIAHATGLPLRLLEIGSSAGLNLRWDCYRYETPRGAFGPADSPVVFTDPFDGDSPDLDTPVTIQERRGCDLHPLDPTTDDGRLTLLSFVWPDQVDRFRLLSHAIDVARKVEVTLDRVDASEWVSAQLTPLRRGAANVVFHSIVWLYLSDEGRRRFAEVITSAGENATPECPLAWLRMEPGADGADVILTMWPGGLEERIAIADYHGAKVRRPSLAPNA